MKWPNIHHLGHSGQNPYGIHVNLSPIQKSIQDLSSIRQYFCPMPPVTIIEAVRRCTSTITRWYIIIIISDHIKRFGRDLALTGRGDGWLFLPAASKTYVVSYPSEPVYVLFFKSGGIKLSDKGFNHKLQ